MYHPNPNTYDMNHCGASSSTPYDQPPSTGLPGNFATQYPPNYSQPPAGARIPWSSGLFDCFSDVKSCCITYWCPCITFGQIAEIVDHGSTSCVVSGALYALIAGFCGCACLYSGFYRSRLREQYMLEESPCWDFPVHCFCETCALCQEYRELQNRGYNMVLGWNGNVQQQNHGVAMIPAAPTFDPGMTR
ncbi:hypothetical protein L6164_001528 [Bauhinia variegata]|uniref:Uncharacterized protein n=1 Tax=Bauhinia variegata TaxID=167791 RepID=A0ACB9QGW3_BAUVA|nr:hypothetical protein L6164_001528 [Bauhinia variegata]